MKSIVKRRLVFVLLFFVCVVLAACSKESSNQSTIDKQKEGFIELSIMDTASTPPPKGTSVQKKIEETTKTILKPTWVPNNEYQSRLNVSLSTGDIPDLVRLFPDGPQLYTSTEVKAIENGLFHDLTEYINDPEFEKKYPNLGKYPKYLWDKMTVGGKIYAIPRHIEPETFSGLWIRKDLLEKAGLEIPTTMDELADVIIKLTDPSNNVYGLQLDGANAIDSPSGGKIFANAFTGVHDWKVEDNGDFSYQSFMPEYKDYLQWLKGLYDAGAIHPEFALGQGGGKFLDGTAGVLAFRWHALVKAERPHVEFAEAVRDEAEPMLIKPVKGSKMWTVEANRGFYSKSVINSKVPKENIPHILKFIDYMGSEEAQQLGTFGIEGEHHDVKDGEKIINKDKVKEDSIGVWESDIRQVFRDYQWFIDDLRVNRGADEKALENMEEIGTFTEEKYLEAKEKYNFGTPHFNLYSPTLLEKWDQLNKDLVDNRVKVVMGEMSFKEWDEYVVSITSSETYKKILEELKEGYLKNK